MAASTNSERESNEKAADSSTLDLLSANFDPLEALSNLNATFGQLGTVRSHRQGHS